LFLDDEIHYSGYHDEKEYMELRNDSGRLEKVRYEFKPEIETETLLALQPGDLSIGTQPAINHEFSKENSKQVNKQEILTFEGRARGLVGYDVAFTRRRS
jgi:hypothetical protein